MKKTTAKTDYAYCDSTTCNRVANCKRHIRHWGMEVDIFYRTMNDVSCLRNHYSAYIPIDEGAT